MTTKAPTGSMRNGVAASRSKATLHSLIRMHYAVMPPAERVLADTLLNFPGQLAGYSATELARISNISNSAVTRFVRRLGFSSYDEMRRTARQELENGAPLYLLDQDQASSAENVVERHLETVIANLRATFSGEAGEMMEQLASAIAVAPQVWITGFRRGRPAAEYLRWSLLHARAQIQLFPSAGETIGESMVDLGKGDILVVFALRRRVAGTNAIIEQAHQRGVRIAIITDPGMTETARASWLLRCQTRTRGPIDDHCAPFLFAHLLTEQTMLKLKKDSRRRLADIDELHSSLTEFE